MSYVLGIDLGTSSLKGVLMNEQGKLVTTKTAEYEIDTPKQGYSEQRVEYWVNALECILKALKLEVSDFGEELIGISFSGQMHSLVVLDKNDAPVYPAILWNDVRTTKQCQEINKKLGTKLYDITKNIALEGFTLPKILWLQENKPDVWGKVNKIMLPKDYLGFWITGNIYTDFSDAAGTLLLDLNDKKWSSEIAEIFNIDMSVLPELVESTTQTGFVKKEIVKKFGLNNDIKVFAGGADNAVAALGAGLINEDLGMISMGTSGVVSSYDYSIADYNGKLHFFNHVIPNSYYSMGVTLAAGNSLNWYKKTFGNNQSFNDLLSDVSTVIPGSEGLIFTPYIMGERTPYFDSKIRGSFLGISARHQKRHFSKAVIEGITFSLRDSKEIMEETKSKKFSKLLSVGGGAQNPDILQIQADVFNTEIFTLTNEQGPGLGACMIAAYGCHLYQTFEDISREFVHYKDEVYKPIPENVIKYNKVYSIWKQAYKATADISSQLVGLN